MRHRLIDLPIHEDTQHWQIYSRLKLPNVFAPTQASAVLDDGTVLGQCARKTYYEQLRYERDMLDSRVYSIFDYGTAFEQRQIDAFKIAGIYVADHVPISFRFGDIYVSGEVDALVNLAGTVIGVEFKTGYGYKFLRNQILGYVKRTTERRPYLLDELQAAPKPEHILQVACYLYYFAYVATPPVPKIEEWRIVYQDRGTCALAEYAVILQDVAGTHVVRVFRLEHGAEYEVALRQISIEAILQRFKYVYEHVLNRTVPSRDFNPFTKDEDWQCEYCVFKQTCIADGDLRATVPVSVQPMRKERA